MADETVQQSLVRVLEALRSTESLLRSAIDDKSVAAEKLTILEVKLENIEKGVASLTSVVRGNGQEGLQIRVKLVEDHLSAIEKAATKKSEMAAVTTKGKWTMWAAVISGVAGLITSIITAFVK